MTNLQQIQTLLQLKLRPKIKKNDLNDLEIDLKTLPGVKSDYIPNLKPMLATLIERPFDSSQWIYEIKWDGYRVVAEVKNGKVHLFSRNRISFNKQFESIVKSLERMQLDNAVFDGEIVVLDENGKSGFQLLQQYLRTG